MAANSTDSLKNAERIIELTEKKAGIQSNISNIVKEINAAEGKNTDALEKQLRAAKVKLDIAGKELKIANGLKDIHDEILDITDKESALLYDIEGNKEKIRKLSVEIKKLEDIGTKSAKEKAATLKDQRDETYIQYETNADIAAQMQAQNKLADGLLGMLGSSVTALSGMKDQAMLFARAMAANPVLILVAALAAALAYTIDMAKNTMTLSQEIGLSATQASKLNKEMGFLQRKFLGFMGQDANAITKSVVDNFGDLNRFTEMSVKDIAMFSMGLGISGEEAVGLARSMESVLPNISTGAEAMDRMQYYAGMAKANGVGTGVVLKDLADNTELFAEFGKDGGENLAKAAVQARKLGLSLETTGKIANSLLDFESSIEKEMEASLLIGKQLNFNKARELALEGDLAGAAKNVMSQIGGKAELQKMNVLQRRALAESIGVSVEELSKLASGKLDVKSDNITPIDANSEAMKLLNTTIGDLRNAILTMMPAFWVLSKVIGAIAKKFGIKVPGMDKTKGITGAKPKIHKTKTGRFQVKGAKGPGHKTMEGALKSVDDVAKTAGDDITKVVSKGSKVLKKVAVPIGVALDAAEVATVAMDKNASKTDVAKTVTEKAAGWAGAAGGAKLGAAGGAAIGSVVPVVGTAVGAAVGTIIGGITGYFASEWAAGEVLDKTAGISSGGEEDKGLSKVLEEFDDLDKEQREELYTAMAGGQSKMNELIDKYDNWYNMGDMGDMIQVLEEVAKNTGKSVTEIANLTRE